MYLKTAHGLHKGGTFPVTLVSSRGTYLCATDGDTLEWNRDEAGPWETFECDLQDGNKVTFKTAHGKYLCADGDDLVCDREEAGAWETFELVEGLDGVGFGLLTAHGKYVCAEEDNAVANREEVGAWETFNAASAKLVDESTAGEGEESGEGAEESTTLPAEIEEGDDDDDDEEEEVNKFGFKDRHAKYEDIAWADLPDRAREAAEYIGFDEDTWDGKEWLDIDDKKWKHLSEKEQKMCNRLGWSRASWDTKYEDYYWKDLPNHVKKAAKMMGWNRESWDEDWDVDCWHKDWEEFSDEEKRCLHVMGYYVHTW
eukprot:scaffold77279_cov55-Cyclotella_meneghiniana.AAC.3